jgi:hypothetical protein
LGVDGCGLGARGHGPSAGRRTPSGAGIGGRGLGLSGMAIYGMGGNGVGDSLVLVTCSMICLTLVAANSCNALESLTSCSVLLGNALISEYTQILGS